MRAITRYRYIAALASYVVTWQVTVTILPAARLTLNIGACAGAVWRLSAASPRKVELWSAGGVLCGGSETLSVMQIATLVLEALLGVFIAYAAYTLFAWTPPSVTKVRDALHYPRWYWVLAGVMAIIGAIGLFAGLFIPVAGAVAAIWLVAYFVVATFSHLVRKDMVGFTYPLVFLVASVGLVALRWADMTPALGLIGR